MDQGYKLAFLRVTDKRPEGGTMDSMAELAWT